MPKRIAYNKTRRKTPKKTSDSLTWDEAVKRFLSHLSGPGEAARYTRQHYERDLDRFKDWWKSDAARQDVTLELAGLVASDLKDYRDFLRTELVRVGTPQQRLRKASTVNTILAAVKSFLAWAQDTGLVEDAPTMPKRVKSARPVYKAVPIPDQKRLVRAIERGRNKRDLAIVMVLLDGGLRVAELCSLLWRDVKLVRGSSEIYVWHGKGDKQRSVVLSSRARLALVALAELGKVPDEPVFKSRKGGAALQPRGVQDILNKYARGLGLHISPHQLRHSFATDALARGNQIPAVQATLGHRSSATTLMYATSSPADLRRVVERGEEEE
jgi:integrase/recombinase XerC